MLVMVLCVSDGKTPNYTTKARALLTLLAGHLWQVQLALISLHGYNNALYR